MNKSFLSALRAFLARRKLRYSWYALALTFLLILALLAVNLVAEAIEIRWGLKIDASPNRITQFDAQTLNTLDRLDEDVRIYRVFQKGDQSVLKLQLTEILDKYCARSAHVEMGDIDPLTEPNKLNKYITDMSYADFTSGGLVVTNHDESRSKLISAMDMYTYNYDEQTGQPYLTGFVGENQITQAIRYVTSDDLPKIWFLTGHGEIGADYCTTLINQLAQENYEVKDFALGQGADVDLPKPGDALVIIMPVNDLTDGEYNELRKWIDDGGRMLFVEDPSVDMSKTPNFTELLNYYGFRFKEGALVEDQASSGSWLISPLYVVPRVAPDHAITAGATDARLILPTPRALEQPKMPLPGFTHTRLLMSSSKSYLKSTSSESESDLLTRDATDEIGEMALALAAQHTGDSGETRIVALGSPYLVVDNQFLSSSHNMVFALSCFDWLVDREEGGFIRGKELANTVLSIPNQNIYLLLSLVVVVFVPGVVALMGIWMYLRRRRL